MTKHDMDAIRSLYRSIESRVQKTITEELNSLNWLLRGRDRKQVEIATECFTSAQCLAVLKLLAIPTEWGRSYSSTLSGTSFGLSESLNASQSLPGVQARGNGQIISLIHQLNRAKEFLLSQEGEDLALKIKPLLGDHRKRSELAYMLVCEGYDRIGKTFTPPDVGMLMRRLLGSNTKLVDVYADYGLGLYYGAAIEFDGHFRLRGNELQESEWRFKPSPRLEGALTKAEYVIDRSAILDRAFTEFELQNAPISTASSGLLINAADFDTPFHPSQDKSPDDLSFLLSSGYAKVVALVKNSFLTGGKYFTSDAVLKHCLSKGLSGVIQLPAGTIGAMHEAYSLLIFERRESNEFVVFREIDGALDSSKSSSCYISERGFGHPWRKFTLNLSRFSSTGETHIGRENKVSVQDLTDRLDKAARSKEAKKEIPSFEAGRFLLQNDREEKSLRAASWVTLGEVATLHRIQHLPSCPPADGIRFMEITAEALGDYGNLSQAEEKYVTHEFRSRLERGALAKNDMFLCIRGPIGRIGYLDIEPETLLIPNQSFVKISLTKLASVRMSPELVYWWIRSVKCQQYLSSRAIMAGVRRLSLADINLIPIPILSSDDQEVERKKYLQWKKTVSEMLWMESEARKIQSTSYGIANIEKSVR